MGHPIKVVVEMIIDFIDASIYVHTCDFFNSVISQLCCFMSTNTVLWPICHDLCFSFVFEINYTELPQ